MIKRVSALFTRRKTEEVGEEIQTLIEERDVQMLDDDEKQLIASVLRFRDVDADSACVPRSDIIAVNQEANASQIIDLFKETGFSRLPVYGKDLDEVIGFLTLKDMLQIWNALEKFTLRKMLRPLIFVPESLPLQGVLTQMRNKRTHMAIVVDEYGGTAGLLTAKDIVEEILGEWDDEHEDDSRPDIQPLSGGKYRIDPRVNIEMLEDALLEKFGIIPHEDYETISGYVLHLTGRVPDKGERVTLPNGGVFVVNSADGRRLRQLTFIPEKHDGQL